MTERQRPHYVHRISYSAQERLVGAFVLAALAVLIGLIIAKGQSTNLFAERITYHGRVQTAQGVSTETPVKVSGIEVGRVSALEISDDNRVDIQFFVYERFRDLIRADSRGSLGKLSMLGNATLNISTGSTDKPVLAEGETLPIKEPQSIDDLIAQASPVVEQMRGAIEDATQIIAAIDPDDIEQATNDLAATAANARAMTGRIKRGEGAVGRVLYDERTQQRLERTLASLAQTVTLAETRMRQLEPVVTDAASTMASVERAGQRLPELVERVDGLVRDLDRTAVSANAKLERLPKLTSEIQALLGDANRTLEGIQRLWPVSAAVANQPPPTLIAPQPAQQ
jgi:phospholipid/cholesterol/gamma-HCH transport system substrate-binding protein